MQTTTKLIPQDLTKYNQWVSWRPVARGDKITKPPINPKSGSFASVADPASWTSYQESISYCKERIGFVLQEADPYLCIDLDDCFENGQFANEKSEAISKLFEGSFQEISPSRKGLHIWIKADPEAIPNNGKKPFEYYSQEHYLTVSGDHLPGTATEITNQQAAFNLFQDMLRDWGYLEETESQQDEEEESTGGGSLPVLTLNDQEILAIAFNDQNFKNLFNDSVDWNDQSRKDWHLCLKIFFYTDDIDQADRIFRSSSLMREKWIRSLGNSTYGRYTLEKAFSVAKNKYSGKRPAEPKTEPKQEKQPQINIAAYIDKSLPAQFWPEQKTVMTAAVDLLPGIYPENEGERTCSHCSTMAIYQTKIKATTAHYAILHSYLTKSGKLIYACEHCLQERALEISKLFEKACQSYFDKVLIKHALMPDAEANRLGDKIRQHNRRDKEGYIYSIVKAPQDNGKTRVFCDHPDLEGETFPTTKEDLYSLILATVKNIPHGRRAWRNLASWGRGPQKKAAPTIAEEAQGQEAQETQLREDDEREKPLVKLLTQETIKLSNLLKGYLDEEINLRKGVEIEIDPAEFLDLLDSAGIDYAVIKGDLSQIRQYTKDHCLKCDKGDGERLPPVVSSADSRPKVQQMSLD